MAEVNAVVPGVTKRSSDESRAARPGRNGLCCNHPGRAPPRALTQQLPAAAPEGGVLPARKAVYEALGPVQPRRGQAFPRF